MTVDEHLSHDFESRLAPNESRIDLFDADLDCGGAPCPVVVLLTTRRVVILPVDPTAAPSPHRLAAPLSVTLRGLGLLPESCEVGLLSEDGILRLQFATRRRALAFQLSVQGATSSLG